MALNYTAEEIMQTIRMVQNENLDIRTITMGISLRDCCHAVSYTHLDVYKRQGVFISFYHCELSLICSENEKSSPRV